MEAAEAAVKAAQGKTKTIPMHTFSGPVEHAIAHIEEAAVHTMPEEQQRWYAIKIFERDDKVLAEDEHPRRRHGSTSSRTSRPPKRSWTTTPRASSPTSAMFTSPQIIKSCYKKKNKGQLSASDKIDKVVTNRWLGLPIFAVVMFLVYWIAMVAVGAPATDWANDGVFGDGWHLLGIGSKAYNETQRRIHRRRAGCRTPSWARRSTPRPRTSTPRRAAERHEELPARPPTPPPWMWRMRRPWPSTTMTAYYDTLPKGADKMDNVVQMTFVDAVKLSRLKTALTRPTPPTTACGSPVSPCWSAMVWSLPAPPTGSAA